LGLFLFIGVGFADGDIGVTAFFFEAAAQIVMAAVYSTSTALTLHVVVPVCGFDFITTYIAANSVSNDHIDFLLWGNSLECIDGVFGFDDQIIFVCHANG
jgi:hypothetical protein